MDAFQHYREQLYEAGKPVQEALKAAEAGDAGACLRAAREGARQQLRLFLRMVEVESDKADVVTLLQQAAERDSHFARLRPEAELLMTPESEADGLGCERILEALKEIRMLAHLRVPGIRSLPRPIADVHPLLQPLVLHSTTVEHAYSVFAEGSLLSWNECVRRGLLSGDNIGVKFLLDPARWLNYVHFGGTSPTYYPGEKVANSQRKGIVDEGLEEDYQPSVRFIFERKALEALPGHVDDGTHLLSVKHNVSLDHLVCAVFPTDEARGAALNAVRDEEQNTRLEPRCLVAPLGCAERPQQYVEATNALVVEWLMRGLHS